MYFKDSLNIAGFPNYCDRYGETVKRVSASYGPTPGWKADDKVRYLQTIFDTYIWDSS